MFAFIGFLSVIYIFYKILVFFFGDWWRITRGRWALDKAKRIIDKSPDNYVKPEPRIRPVVPLKRKH